MRTTINLPDEVLSRAKKAALETRTTLTDFIANALAEALARRRRRRPSIPADLVTYGTGGLQPGVDLDDTSALLDLMDAPDDAHRR